jgi:hypothetical protein
MKDGPEKRKPGDIGPNTAVDKPIRTSVYSTKPVFQFEGIPNTDGYRVLISRR